MFLVLFIMYVFYMYFYRKVMNTRFEEDLILVLKYRLENKNNKNSAMIL